MTMLLTGAGGFLGSRIASSLLESGVRKLRLLYRQNASERQVGDLRARFPEAEIDVVCGNLLAKGFAVDALKGVDSVVHAAAGMKGAAADMFLNTVVASRNLLEGIAANGVRRVTLISSFSVYRTVSLSRGASLDESVPREPTGLEKGNYGYAKTRQEQLFDEYQRRSGFDLMILRPGVIYGPGGGAFSVRVGISALGRFWALGGSAVLPLTYVDNCADAVATVALKAKPATLFNVVDDELPTCAEYLYAYRKSVSRIKVFPIPYPALLFASMLIERYSIYSKGQLPAVFTPYVVRSMYRPLRYPNKALKSLGWTPLVSTREGMSRTFDSLRGG